MIPIWFDFFTGIEDFSPLQGDFVLGKQMSYADLALVDAEPWLERTIPDVKLPEKLKAVVTKVEADPKVAKYLASRPKSAF